MIKWFISTPQLKKKDITISKNPHELFFDSISFPLFITPPINYTIHSTPATNAAMRLL